MVQMIDNNPWFATFKAAASLSTKFADVYISASMTVAEATTITNMRIGNVDEISAGGAGSSVRINMFAPIRKGIARGTIAAGGKISYASTTTGWVAAPTAAVAAGIAVTGAASATAIFSYVLLPNIPTVT